MYRVRSRWWGRRVERRGSIEVSSRRRVKMLGRDRGRYRERGGGEGGGEHENREGVDGNTIEEKSFYTVGGVEEEGKKKVGVREGIDRCEGMYAI